MGIMTAYPGLTDGGASLTPAKSSTPIIPESLHPNSDNKGIRPDQDVSQSEILFLVPGFAADEHDDTCIPPLQLLARALQEAGVGLHIITMEYPFHRNPYRWHGIPVYPCGGANRRWHKPQTLYRAARMAEQLRAAHSFVAIHSFWLGWASSVGEWVSQRSGIPHYTTLAGQDVLPGNRLHLRRLRPGRAGRLVVLSDFQRTVFRQNTGLDAGHCIPWGLPADELAPAAAAVRDIDILGVGSLVAVKNWSKWLQVVAMVALKRPNVRAVLIGDGPQRAELMRQVVGLGLTGRVHLAGTLSRQEVLGQMSRAKILLHTSDFESYGMVYAEAAARGCALVSTPVGIAPGLGAACTESASMLAMLLLKNLDGEPVGIPQMPASMEAVAARYLAVWRAKT